MSAAAGAPARVLHFPDWRHGNPYQALLADGLAGAGIEVAFATYVGALFPLWRNVRKHRAGTLHLHWIGEIAGADEASFLKHVLKQIVFRLDVAAVRRLLRGRIVWTVHNLASHDSRRPTGDLAARRFLAGRVRRLIAHCAVARGAVVDAYQVPPERVAVIPFGNFVGAYPNGATREESRRRLGIPLDRFVFLYLGSLRPYKGVENLLECFARLPEPRKHLVVAGHASDPAYLAAIRQRAASPDVQLEGRFISADELQFFFNSADAVVLPFREVLTSASLVLAMGFGRMVVAPRIGCIPEYTDPAGSVLYDTSEPGALEGALALALSRDPEACGRHNLERARGLDWKVAAGRTADIYASLSGR